MADLRGELPVSHLGHVVDPGRDAARVERGGERINRLQAVRVHDVQRVLDQYVLRAKRVTIDYVQGAAA